MSKNTRKSVCAGSWYSANAKKLAIEIDGYLEKAENQNLNIKALIAPHAGYAYSGQTAAFAYKQLNHSTKKVVILGTAHYYPLQCVSVTEYDYYETPFGNVKVNSDVYKLAGKNDINSVPEADKREHSIDIQLPFLQRTLDDFEILPLIVGRTDSVEFSKILEKFSDEGNIIIASVDLSHFHDDSTAKKLDDYSIESILNLNPDAIKRAEIDSPYAIMSLLELAKREGWKAKLLDYRNSGDVSGDYSRVVGYGAIAFYADEYSRKEKSYILALAKKSVEEFVSTGKKVKVDDAPSSLRERKGCFVTLTINGNLRGCIGTIEPRDILYKGIIDNAIHAATRDYRFEPVTVKELNQLEYEVSILTEPEKLSFGTEDELFRKIKDKGVIISQEGRRAVYLPQVWEKIESERVFLDSLFKKAGLRGYNPKEKFDVHLFDVTIIE
jgi:uncharacterized protein, PH0010 family